MEIPSKTTKLDHKDMEQRLGSILVKATHFLDQSALKKAVKKIRIYGGKLIAIDFKYRSVRYAFDIVPQSDLRASLSVIQRSHLSDFLLLDSKKNKELLAEDLPISEVLSLIESTALALLNKSKQYLETIELGQVFTIGDYSQPYDVKNFVRESKRVGIITLPLNRNIGGNLQAYALCQILRDLGHKPIFINRRAARKPADNLLSVEETNFPDSLFSNSIGFETRIPNADFIETNIAPISKLFTSSDALQKDFYRYNLDAVITGSDQVWRPKYAKSLLNDLYLQFIPDSLDNVKRISYAASFGAATWEYDKRQTTAAYRLAQKFDYVSVREDSAIEISRDNLGVPAKHVLDPTMLLTADHYASKFTLESDTSQGNRLLAYVLDINQSKADLIQSLANALNLKAYFTSGDEFQYPLPESGHEGNRSVEAWLASLYNASFVITDSFHGTVFAILFNKPFISYGNPKRGMARFLSILKMFGLENRLVDKFSMPSLNIAYFMNPIDWAAVNEKLDVYRQTSLSFLQNAILSPKRPSLMRARGSNDKPSELTFGSESGIKITSSYAREAASLAQYDCLRFLKAHEKKKVDYTAAQSRLMYSAHAVEKGLSRVNFRPGFGLTPVSRLAKEMGAWYSLGRPIDDEFFRAAASVMRAYFKRHEQLAFDISEFRAMFDPSIINLIMLADNEPGGVVPAYSDREESVQLESTRSFLDVVYARRSIRDFTSQSISDSAIHTAVQIAMQSPSVCNRQAARVHYFKEPDKIAKLIDIQGGFRGYEKPPGLCLVSSELTAFLNAKERNQGFIDGGLFLMSLLLGLEQVGLGACPLNTAMDLSSDTAVRRVLDISDTEVLIAFIAVGHYDPKVLIPRSKRLPVHAVLTTHGK
jgi:nitroreductase